MKVAVIILAAGMGKRMNSLIPKPLHRIGGRPLLAWALDSAASVDADRIITVVPKNAKTIIDWLDGHEICQQDKPKGTGHAVLSTTTALKDFDGTALIMCADTPLITGHSLCALAKSIASGADIAVLGAKVDDPFGYGRLILNNRSELTRIVEEKDTNESEREVKLINAGVMAVRCPLLFDLLQKVDSDNMSSEIYLTDVVALANQDKMVTKVVLAPEDEVIGINSCEDLAKAERIVQQKLRKIALQNGVTMLDPETVYLSADTRFESDVVIEPNVFIGQDTTIGRGCLIKSFSHIEGTILGPDCVIGPFTRLRSGTKTSESVKIGNFVETKNTELGSGSKASHLTYLGDSKIGSQTNIGAGTITCNFDGFGKFKTLIGDAASVGSNTALVAPVTIGSGAIVGAGSTITADVPDNAIATTRSALDVRNDAATRYRSSRSGENE